jgi:hypothetical protein
MLACRAIGMSTYRFVSLVISTRDFLQMRLTKAYGERKTSDTPRSGCFRLVL